MQTFLSEETFVKSIQVLDKQRAWKQCVEAYQIVNVIERDLNGIKAGYINHPVSRMWYNDLPALRFYYNTALKHCKNVLGINTSMRLLTHAVDYKPEWYTTQLVEAYKAVLYNKSPFYSEYSGYSRPFVWPMENSMNRSPMLLPNDKVDLSKDVTYPVLMSLKLDGIRGIFYKGKIFSRNLKELPNRFLPVYFKELIDLSLKGWVIDTEIYDPASRFTDGASIIRSHASEIPQTTKAYVIDFLSESGWDSGNGDLQFIMRLKNATKYCSNIANCTLLDQTMAHTAQEVQNFFTARTSEGEEGIVLTNPFSYYKHGRATLAEKTRCKLKNIQTLDAEIIQLNQGRKMREETVRTLNPAGYLERPYKIEDYEPDDILGSFTVRDSSGRVFSVGCGIGMTLEARREIWSNRHQYTGKIIEIESIAVGELHVPRMGKFVRFRPDKETC